MGLRMSIRIDLRIAFRMDFKILFRLPYGARTARVTHTRVGHPNTRWEKPIVKLGFRDST